MGCFGSEHFAQMPFAEAYVRPFKMTYRARREAQAHIPEGIVLWGIGEDAEFLAKNIEERS
jgi:hypothetical protein